MGEESKRESKLSGAIDDDDLIRKEKQSIHLGEIGKDENEDEEKSSDGGIDFGVESKR